MAERFKGIVLFDNDGTLMQTQKVFGKVMRSVADYLNPSGHSDGITEAKINIVQSGIVVKTGVEPKRIWPATMNQLRREYILSDSEYRQALELLMSIYSILPDLYPDAISTVQKISEIEYRLGMVTQARRDWTKFKLNGTGLDRYFPNPCVINVRGHKGPESWRRAVRHYRINGNEEVWVVGDSIRSDIYPAYKSGLTNNLIWVDRDSKWLADHNTHHLFPECAFRVMQLEEVPEIVRRGRDLNPR